MIELLARWRALLNAAAGRDARELLVISAEALGRYKLRTALSVLGVVLGIAAVIAMMSVSEGARHEALQQMELLGLHNLMIRNRGLSLDRMRQAGETFGLKARDVDSLRRLIPLTKAVSPLVERYLSAAAPESKRRMIRVLGVSPEYGRVLRLATTDGRFLASIDEKNQAAVCVLGANLARGLFGFRDPVGRSISIDGRWYRVAGVLAERGSDARAMGALPGRDLNQAALVPLSTLLGRSLDLDPHQRIDEIWLQAADGERVSAIGRVVEHSLSRLHKGLPDFEVVVPRELLEQRYRTQRTFSVVVGSVAVLSLIVGGIGIMNIMLASVLERTREIGIRRTVGARRRDITAQFLVESLLLTLSGGLAGVLLGAVVSLGITAYAGWHTRISLIAVMLGVSVSVLVGLAFGIYPARQAARLEPIDALRYE
ncbi:MAG: ABC transporter permease [Vicinamibacteria bacterium]|nr:ABC transporter permease [Vicinamibacteria bacterium]